MKKKVLVILFFLIFFSFEKSAYAKDYLVDYQIQYRPFKKEGKIIAQVNFNIKITHLRSDIYVNKFKLIFPENFKIDNLQGKDDRGKVDISLEKINFNNELTINLTNPNVGKNSVNNISISFFQEQIFKEVGNIIESLIPTINDNQISSYQVIVYLPKSFGKKISLAKPQPDLIKQNEKEMIIYWNNYRGKTIYALFGDKQYYNLRLIYQIKNDQLAPVYQFVSLLPETSYQKVYINKIIPPPESVFLDEDGNLIGKYLLLPQKKQEITLEGNVVITNNENIDKINYDRNQVNNQKKYLLSQTNDWSIANPPKEKFDTVESIYRYIVEKLSYDYKKVGQINKRAKPDEILTNYQSAICLDYTDLFVSLARDNGIFSRAIIGYGYSQEERLRPISLQGDVLHSWAEYFNEKKLIWQPIDPTWEDTSGIDYFSSLDFNHIAFVILGKNSDRPLPAGMYKFDQQQKIFITPKTNKPQSKINLKVYGLELPKKIISSIENNLSFYVKNQGNVYLYNLPIKIKSDHLSFSLSENKIDILPPLASKKITIKITSNNQSKNLLKPIKGKTQIKIGDYFVKQYEYTIIPFYYQLAIIFIGFSFSSGVIILLFKIKRRL